MKLESAKAPFMILLGSTLICCILSVSAAMYWGLLMPEGNRAISPIALPQGAPYSHYATEHSVAQGLIVSISSPIGALLMMAAGVVFSTLWYYARRRWRVMIDLACVSIVSMVLATVVSAVMAFHHVGWGIACNHQWFAWFLCFSIPSGTAFLISRAEPQSEV